MASEMHSGCRAISLRPAMSYQYGELKGQGHMYIPSPGMIINHSLFGSGSCSAGQGSHLSPNTFSPGHGTAKLKKAGTPGERLRLGLEALLSQGRGPGGETGPGEAMSPRGLDLSMPGISPCFPGLARTGWRLEVFRWRALSGPSSTVSFVK